MGSDNLKTSELLTVVKEAHCNVVYWHYKYSYCQEILLYDQKQYQAGEHKLQGLPMTTTQITNSL